MKAVRASLLTIVTLSTTLSFAWDNPGHMAVADLAYMELSANQRTHLAAILRSHPDFSPITNGFPPSSSISDHDLIVAAATWPDRIKSTPGYEDNGYEAQSPAPTALSFDHKMHKGWHFIDTPIWIDQSAAPSTLPPIPATNAVTVVNVLVAQLQSAETDPQKAYDLCWLMHLVGDLHQPLHAVTGVSESLPHGDTGGNAIAISGEANGETELHAFWDDVLGKSARPDPRTHRTRLEKDVATAGDITDEVKDLALGDNAEDLNPMDWANESKAIAKSDVYDIQIQSNQDGKASAVLDADYGVTARRDAQARVRLAGHRLALWLEKILGQQ
jgi:S1/P1 nuclease